MVKGSERPFALLRIAPTGAIATAIGCLWWAHPVWNSMRRAKDALQGRGHGGPATAARSKAKGGASENVARLPYTGMGLASTRV